MSDSTTDLQTLPSRALPSLPTVGSNCAACAGPVEAGDHFCPACGTPLPAPEAKASAPADKAFRCENCGATVEFPAETRSFRCPFCDSTYVVELPSRETGRQRPEFVIGFAVTPEQARARFREWIGRGSSFRPGDLSRSAVTEKLRGVYLPFWSFSMRADSRWRAQIGEYWYRTETYTVTVTRNGKTTTETRTRRVRETEWWPLAGKHHAYHRGYLVSGSRGLPQSEAEWVLPFRLEALKRYEPRFLAGWLSEEYSVEREVAFEETLREFHRREHDAVAAFLPGDTYSGLEVETDFSRIGSDLILLPVYVLSYRYGDRVFRFLVNGQTGRCEGEKPWSKGRITAFVVTLVVVLLLLFLLIMLLQ